MVPELPAEVTRDLRFDYTTLGHVTVDVLADGSRRPGGSAFYSALQAARLGKRALIITRGAPRELEQLLEPYRAELELRVARAPCTTTLYTSGVGAARRQRMLAWSGPLAPDITVRSRILHLAPVARETPGSWRGRADFVGLTPQGLARVWPGEGGEISLRPPEAAQQGADAPADTAAAPGAAAADRCDALVVSAEERASCASLIAAARRAGAVVAITAGARPTTVLLPDGGSLQLAVTPPARLRDDLGAGDVFAAAFFVSLQEGSPPAQAAAFANAAAAVRLRGVGAQAIGSRATIEAALGTGAPS